SVEWAPAAGKNFSRLLAAYVLALDLPPATPGRAAVVAAAAEGGKERPRVRASKGPSDLHIHWLINGHSLASPIEEYRRPVGPGEVLVSSWLREGPLIRDARYHCVAEAGTGSDASEVDLRLTIGDEESVPSRDLNQWRGALTEHEQLLKRWEKAWESCDGH
uniref:Semaphorin 4D n=1 Tax=Gasterosteus aculeatus TaxID=69293 RepID=G3PW28_GASAC